MVFENEFKVSKDKESLAIELSSTLDNIDRADQETRKFLQGKTLVCDVFAISLVMREVLTNAVKHGHQFDAGKTVSYRLEIKSKYLIMEIEDQGDGFDWRQIERRNPQPDADHGRGLKIIQEYFTDYQYNEKGNRITLIKALNDVSPVV